MGLPSGEAASSKPASDARRGTRRPFVATSFPSLSTLVVLQDRVRGKQGSTRTVFRLSSAGKTKVTLARAFTNRRLFSDHYLEEVAPTLEMWTADEARAEAAQRELRQLFV